LDCLKSGLVVFVKRNIPASDVNSHTVTCQIVAAADKPAQLELNCSDRSDFYIDLHSVRILLRVKLE
jgi:hypothetical protein